MNSSIYIETNSLKELLSLFAKNESFTALSIGDTWHPLSGYVEEGILKGKHKVSDILKFDYDFKGLVHFEWQLKSLKTELITHSHDDLNGRKKKEYRIDGDAKEIETLKNKIIEANAYQPEKYKCQATIDRNN